MKKVGLLAIVFACFTIVFAIPSASANRGDVTPNQYGNTAMDDMNVNRTTNRIGNDLNRAGDRVLGETNRVANQAEKGMNRTFGARDYDAYDTDNNMLNRNNYRATTTTPNRGFSWGWLGLLGLLGLAGMRSKERDRA